MKTAQRLSSKGVKVPMTVFAKNPIHVDWLIKKLGGLPVVGKLLSGSQGVGVMIFKDAEQTNTSLASFYKLNVDVLLQRFIDAGSSDVRAIVVGDEVTVAMERKGKSDFRANISQGGIGKKVELSQDEKDLCIKAAKAVGLEFAGVDLIRDKNGNAFILEVNGNPGTKIIDITGHNYFDDLVSLIEKRLNYKASESTQIDEDEAKVAPTVKTLEALESTVGKQASLQQVKQFAKIQGSSEYELSNKQHLKSTVMGFISRGGNHKKYPKLVASLNSWRKAA